MLYQLSYTPAAGRGPYAPPRALASRCQSRRRAAITPRMHAPVRPPQPIPAELLLLAYRSGIFPMADHREDPDVYWVEPRERGVIPLDGFILSRSLAKTVKRDRFRVTCDAAFAQVIAQCAAPREEHAESWISRRIESSYLALHAAGHAHSIECWLPAEDGSQRLGGGLYGVAFDRVFCGESMFSRADNASKVALAWLVAGLRRAGYALLDCQFMTDHLATLGAVPISQADYLARVKAARGTPALTLPQAIASFSASVRGVGAGAGVAGGEGVAAGEDAPRGGEERVGPAAPPGAPASPSSPGKRIAQSLTQTS
jgi:leucyl/phenylalanyl-tRNA---protein transferase